MTKIRCGILILVLIVSISHLVTSRVFFFINDLSKQAKFKITKKTVIQDAADHDEIPSSYVAWALFDNRINQTGFAQLEVHTNENHTDWIQAYHAGFLEGFLTAELMAMHWRNQIETYCDEHAKFCNRLLNFLTINLKHTQSMVRQFRESDSYWHQVGLVLEQLTGLQDGYNLKLWDYKPRHPRMEVDARGMIALSILPELHDFESILKKVPDKKYGFYASCSALIKPLEDGSDLYVGHNTWVWYSMMMRIVKKYDFNFHRLPNSKELVPATVAAFSSYPGALFSMDDFYVLSSGLVVQETSIENTNNELWKQVKPKKVVLEFIRNIVANKLASSGREWTEIFSKHNSGTYNDQFMIIDYNKFEIGTKPEDLADDLLWIVEQMPGKTHAADLTSVLRKQKYFASYNIPYFEDIYNISGHPKLAEQFGDYYDYNKTARAQIFRRDHSLVKDLPLMYKLMRYNDFRNDPLSRCNCTPPYTAEYAISARNDLNDPEGRYPFETLSMRDWGAIDAKITDKQMVKLFQFLFVSSPTYDQQEPFQWSTTKLPKSIKREGLPDKWAFEPYHVKWYPNDNQIAGVRVLEKLHKPDND